MTRRSSSGARRAIAYAAVAAALLVIGVATLWPTQESEFALEHFCLLCGTLGLQDFLDNVLLFLPLGVALRLVGLGRSRAVVVTAIVTATVEFLQYKVVAGRDASIGDLVSNTLGGALGVALADGWRHLLLPTPRVARGLALLGSLGWLAVLGLTAWGLGPSVVPGVYEVEWTPDDPRLSEYHGVLLSALIDGRPAPPGPLRDGDAVLDALRRQRLRLEVLATTGNERSEFAPIARVMQVDRGRDTSELVAIGQRGCDAEFHVRLRVGGLRLRGPAIGVPRVFPCGGLSDRAQGEPEGDSIALTGLLEGSALRVTTVRGGATTSRVLDLTPTLGWSFFLPWTYAFGGTDWPLSALWAGGLLLAVGYWAGRGDASWSLPLLAASIVLGFGALPPATGLAVPSAGEWGATLLGALGGWWAGRRGRRLEEERGDSARAA